MRDHPRHAPIAACVCVLLLAGTGCGNDDRKSKAETVRVPATSTATRPPAMRGEIPESRYAGALKVSRSVQAASKPLCSRYVVAAKKQSFALGGARDIVKTVESLQAVRRKFATDIRSLQASSSDRRQLAKLAAVVDEANALLEKVAASATADDQTQTFQYLAAYNLAAQRESSLTERLRLKRCS